VPSAKDRAKQLAVQLRAAVAEAKAAEARARRLGEQVMQALAEVRQEAEAVRTGVEYPSGRYECASCRQSVLFTHPSTELSPCFNCGARNYRGPKPKVTHIAPPTPSRYPSGMYECTKCHIRAAFVEGVDVLPDCEFCGAKQLKQVG